MSLSPDEERRFNAIVAELSRGRVVRIPWPAVVVSIVLVGVVALSAVFLGLGAGLAILFCASFLVAFTAGLLLLARSDRRNRLR